MKKFVLLPLALLTFAPFGCREKKKTYTIKGVRTDLKSDYDAIREHRQAGRLDKASSLAVQMGRRILKEYPTEMMYREIVRSYMAYAMRLTRLCRDKELELKNESTRPEEAEIYKTHRRHLDQILLALRKKINTIPWMVPPKPKAPKTPPETAPVQKKKRCGKEEKNTASTKGKDTPSSATPQGNSTTKETECNKEEKGSSTAGSKKTNAPKKQKK